MGFRENLKGELTYAGMLVKELAARSGVNKRAIDSYLCENGSLPSVDVGVKIARALGVTVEYLVTGRDKQTEAAFNSLNAETRTLAQLVECLDAPFRKAILDMARTLKGFQDEKGSRE